MTKTKTRGRAKAPAIEMPRTAEAANALLEEYGKLARMVDGAQAAFDEEVAALKALHEERVKPKADRMRHLAMAIQLFAEANREALTRGGRTKTVKWAAGALSWRTRPPRVQIKGEKTLVEWLLSTEAPRRLKKFLRAKWSIDRETMLKDQEAALTIDGVQILYGEEDFIIEPAGMELAEARS